MYGWYIVYDNVSDKTDCWSFVLICTRDLGSCLTNIRVLWMARCATSDVDSIASLTNLCELYLAYNDIVDISPCSLLEHIQILDLEGFAYCILLLETFLAVRWNFCAELCHARIVLIKFSSISSNSVTCCIVNSFFRQVCVWHLPDHRLCWCSVYCYAIINVNKISL